MITCGQSIPEYSVDCVERPLRSKNMCEYSQKMKDTQVSLKRTSLLSVVKNKSDKEKDNRQNIILKSLREENPNRLVFLQININSVKNKIQFLASQIINNVDVLLVSETELDDSFPTVQFLLHGFSKPYRLDRCSNGDRIFLCVKHDIVSFANKP